MSRRNTPTCTTLNWPADNKALKRRGSLTIWFDADLIWLAKPTAKRGRQPVYGGEEDQKTVPGTVFPTNVQTGLTMKRVFGMALRQIEPWQRHWSA